MADQIISKSYNIHGLLRIHAHFRRLNKFDRIKRYLAEFEEEFDLSNQPHIVLRDYEDAPSLKNETVAANFYFFADNILKIPDIKLCYKLTSFPLEVYYDQLNFPLSLLIHLGLLTQGYSLVHASGVEFKGRRYLFPSLGGVGKTSVAATVVKQGGKLYGDDWIIVDHNTMYSYPQDLSVYPYHMELLQIKDKDISKVFKKTSILNSMTRFLERYCPRPAFIRIVLESRKVPYVYVPPRRAFGDNCFASPGSIDEIYYLKRTVSNAGELKINKLKVDEITKVALNALFHELWSSNMHLYIYASLSSFSFENAYRDTRNVLAKLFSSKPCYLLEAPVSMSDIDFRQNILEYLNKK